MYIVNHGMLDVFIDDKRIAGLEDGAVFGEISLLEVAGGNRRTADVSRSSTLSSSLASLHLRSCRGDSLLSSPCTRRI